MNGFVPEDNEVQIIWEHIKDLFGEETILFVGLERKYNTVFDQTFLVCIRDFTDAVEQIPIVKEVTSILTMPYITADGDSIFVTDLVDEDFTGTPDEIAELKRRLASWDFKVQPFTTTSRQHRSVFPSTSAWKTCGSLKSRRI
jgi:predicted RND superfamily exporter protein